VYSIGLAFNSAVFLDGSLHSIGGYDNDNNTLSLNRIASLCGVYTFSGPCDDENQCTLNDTCKSNGTCKGTPNMSCPTTSNPCQSNTCNITWCCNVQNGTPCNFTENFHHNASCPTSCMILTGECLKNNSSSVSIPIATIVGIIIALLVFIAMIIIAIVLLLKYKRKRQSSDDKNVIKIEPFPSKNDNENVYTEIAPPNYSFRANATIADTVASSNYIIKMSKLKIKKKIGEGAFGCVYLGIFNKTEVAIKKLSKTNISDVDIKAFIAEAELMRNLPPHPNVVLFRGVTVPPDPLSIITDYCNGGSLTNT